MQKPQDIHKCIVAAAALLGRLGGLSTSPAKVAASRANGRKGGRPCIRCKSCFFFASCTSRLPASVYCPSFKR